MHPTPHLRIPHLPIVAVVLVLCALAVPALATEPCGDFGACKALIEINASDGDIGFHFLMDGSDLLQARIKDPGNEKIFEYRVFGALADQTLTETFAESAEPLCWPDPDADPDDEIVTLAEFLERWEAGTYRFAGNDVEGERLRGRTELTLHLPAAPVDVDFDGSVISWNSGNDLGNCATAAELDDLVFDGELPVHPEDVPVDAWEVVMEPDVEDGDPVGSLVYSLRVDGDISPMEVTVPADYLMSLPENTLVKIEVGAIAGEDNATFTEEDGFCVNEVGMGCEDEE